MAQSVGFDSARDSSTRHQRINTRELQASNRALCLHCFEAYKRVKNYPALCAVDPDPDSTSRSIKWTPQFAHFIVDVENAVSEALKEFPELQSAFFALVAGETVPEAIAQQVFSRCGRFFKSRKLDPGHYFRPMQRRPVSAATRLWAA